MSQESANAIKYILQKKKKSKVHFCKITGVSRSSLYKYLHGLPIHPKKARQIVDGVKSAYGLTIPIEKLID